MSRYQEKRQMKKWKKTRKKSKARLRKGRQTSQMRIGNTKVKKEFKIWMILL